MDPVLTKAMTEIAEAFRWSVYINATTLLIIVGIFGWYFRQIQREIRDVAALTRDVAAMTRDVAAMTREVLRKIE